MYMSGSSDYLFQVDAKATQHGRKGAFAGYQQAGESVLRTLFVHGARAVVAAAKRHSQSDHLSEWIKDLSTRKHANVVNVALANKTARIA